MKKVIFLLAIATSLVACGGNASTEATSTDSTTVDTTAVAVDSTVTGTATPTVDSAAAVK